MRDAVEAESLKIDPEEGSKSVGKGTASAEPAAKRRKQSLFSIQVLPVPEQECVDLSAEIKEYLRESETSLQKLWSNPKWSSYTIGKVAKRIFSIPATSAASERAFSKAGLLMSPLRSSTGERTPEMLC